VAKGTEATGNASSATVAGGSSSVNCHVTKQELTRFVNIPLVQADQTVDSFIAMAGIQNGFTLGCKLTRAVLGSDKVRPDCLLHGGLLQAYEALRGFGHDSYEQLVESHSFLPLFKPFVSTTTYSQVASRLKSNKFARIEALLATTNVSVRRDEYRYCVHCAERTMDTLGIAYAYRTHQILGVEFCPEHGSTLCSVVPTVTSSEPMAQGLILPSEEYDWHSKLTPITPLCESPEWRSLGKWVLAVLNGDFPATSEDIRAALFRRRIDEIPRTKGDPCSPAAHLERHLARTYGDKALESLGLPIFTGNTAHWPAFLVFGTAFTRHPLANLLTLSALFASPEEFAGQVVALGKIPSPVETAKLSSVVRPPCVSWDLSIAREFYRGSSANDIAQRTGYSYETIICLIFLHPEMRERCKAFRDRQERKKMRRIIEDFVANNPAATRSNLRRNHFHVFQWIMKNDLQWFEDQLPRKRQMQKDQFAEAFVMQLDEEIAKRMSEIAMHHIDNGCGGRISKSLFYGQMNPFERRLAKSGRLQNVVRIIDSLVEQPRTHIKRLENYLITRIASCDVSRATQVAKEAKVVFGKKGNYFTEIINNAADSRGSVNSLQEVA
jgi:hypothetical protein